MVREKIIKLIQKAVSQPLEKIQVKHSENIAYGDYSANIALQLKKPATEIAEKLKCSLFEKIEIKGLGFINFFISKKYLQEQIKEILKKKEKYGELSIGEKKKIQVEFISANPTGPLHIGNGRGAFFGDTLANVLEKAGFKVVREYYINDAKKSNQIQALGKTTLGRGTIYLTEKLKTQIFNLRQSFGGQAKLTEGEAGYQLAQIVQKDIKNFIERKLKIKFDKWVSEEKDLYQKGKLDKIQKWLEKKNLIYEKDGAKWIKTSEHGDDKDWVVIRETGEPTYLLLDIAYHKDKFNRKFDKVIDIWGADHQGHVGKMKAIAKMLNYKGDFDVLISQVVRLKKGKISKREGKTITLEWLIGEVGLDAVRFFYLMKSLDTQMEFDIELAKERSAKSPVYYVQYAHARICSILRKAKTVEVRLQRIRLEHPSELNLIRQLIRFPEIVEDTAKDYQVQRIPQYAMNLATAFHQFYRDCRVLTEDRPLSEARLGLVLAVKVVLKNTLNLMGVSAPEKM